jgi:hypothetical protein
MKHIQDFGGNLLGPGDSSKAAKDKPAIAMGIALHACVSLGRVITQLVRQHAFIYNMVLLDHSCRATEGTVRCGHSHHCHDRADPQAGYQARGRVCQGELGHVAYVKVQLGGILRKWVCAWKCNEKRELMWYQAQDGRIVDCTDSSMSHRNAMFLRVVGIPLLDGRILDVMAPRLATHDPCFCGLQVTTINNFLDIRYLALSFRPKPRRSFSFLYVILIPIFQLYNLWFATFGHP